MSGNDGYRLVLPEWFTTPLFHGIVRVGDLSSMSPSEISEAFHREFLALLGVNTLIDSNGQSFLSESGHYYSRLDGLTQMNGMGSNWNTKNWLQQESANYVFSDFVSNDNYAYRSLMVDSVQGSYIINTINADVAIRSIESSENNQDSLLFHFNNPQEGGYSQSTKQVLAMLGYPMSGTEGYYQSLPLYAFEGMNTMEYIHYGEGDHRIELTPMLINQDQLGNTALLSDTTCWVSSEMGMLNVQWDTPSDQKSMNGMCLFQVTRKGTYSEPVVFYYPTTTSLVIPILDSCEFVPNGRHGMDGGSCGLATSPSGYFTTCGTIDRYTSGCSNSTFDIPTVTGNASTLAIVDDIMHFDGNSGSFIRATAKAYPNIYSDYEEFTKVALVASLAAEGQYRIQCKARSVALNNPHDAYITFALSTSTSMGYSNSTFPYTSNGISRYVETIPVALPAEGAEWIDIEHIFTLPTGYANLNTLHIGLAFNTGQVSIEHDVTTQYAVLIDELYLQHVNYSLEIPYDTLCLGQLVENLNQYANPPLSTSSGGGIYGNGVTSYNGIFNLNVASPVGEQIITFQSTQHQGCITTDTIMVVNHLTLPIVVEDPVCEGNTTGAYVNIPQGIECSPYWWIQPSNSTFITNPISFVLNEASTINFVGTNNAGCEITGTATVGVIGTPPVTGTVVNVINGGNNGSIDLFVPSEYQNIHWSGPNGYTSMTEDIFNLEMGTYTATVMFPTGCSREVSFQIHSISLSITQSTCYDPCVVNNCNLTGTLDFNTLGSVLYYIVDGTIMVSMNPDLDNGVFTALCPGMHSVQVWMANCASFTTNVNFQINCNSFPEDISIISGTTTWALGSSAVHANVIVQNGATLVIAESTHSFLPRKRIIVQPGGKLKLMKNAVLTSYCPSSRWMGVEVRGNSTNPALASTLIGRIEGSKSIIKNASIGVLVGLRGNGDNVNAFGYNMNNVGSGGTARLDGMRFENNLQDFAAAPLTGYISDINIKNSTFKLDTGYFAFGPVIPLDRILINNRSKVQITNTRIINYNASLFNNVGFAAISGLYAKMSDFYMNRCSISGFPYGIYQNGTSAANNGTELYSSIIRCYRGAYFSHGDKHSVHDNKFYSLNASMDNNGLFFPALPLIFMDNIAGDQYDNDLNSNGITFNSSYGLYYKSMLGLDCGNNLIDLSINNYNPSAMLRVGIYVQNSSQINNNDVFLNEVHNCTVGMRFYDSNRDDTGKKGLRFYCNEFKLNDFDVELNASPGVVNPVNFGIKQTQGGPVDNSNLINLPHNSFFTTNSNPWDDMNDFVSTAPGYHTYYYKEGFDILDTNEVHDIILVEVEEYNNQNNTQKQGISMCSGKSLPEDFMSILSDLSTDIQHKQSQIADSIYQMGFQDYVLDYLTLTDNSNDDEVYSYLLNHATELNDKTLFELAQQTSHFNTNQVLQLLQASSVSGFNNEVVLNFAYNHPSLTSSQYNALVNTFDAVAERVVLVDSLGLLTDSLQSLMYLAMMEIALDSTSADTSMVNKCAKIQLIDALCASSRTELSQITSAMYQGEFDLADTLISLYQQKLHPDMQTSKDLNYLHSSLMDLYRMYYLTDSILSSQDSLTLEYFSMPEYPMTFRFATYLLDSKVNNQLRETLNYPQVNNYRIHFADEQTEESNTVQNMFTVSPNPSTGQVMIRLKEVEKWNEVVELTVHDITGKRVYRASNPSQLASCFTQGLYLPVADGLYTVQLTTLHGKHNQKLIIQH
jgi:hypothetical protein